MKELQVKLDTPIEYHFDGEVVKCEFVLINKPTAKQVHLTSIIRSIFQSNLMNVQRQAGDMKEVLDQLEEMAKEKAVKADGEGEKEEKEESLTWSDAITILYSDPEKIERLTVSFMELMRTGLFLLDGETKMTKPLVESLDAEDFDKLIGNFTANFTFASLMRD